MFFLQVSPDEMEIFEEIKSVLGDDENNDSNLISPFSLLSKNAVESLRYRAEVIVQLFFLSRRLFNKNTWLTVLQKRLMP